MPQKKKKRDKIERIETLIEKGYYDEAEALLKDMYHPDTPQIVRRINALRPAKVTVSAREKNKTKRLRQAFGIGIIIGIVTTMMMHNISFGFLMFFIACGLSYVGLRNMDSEDDYFNRSQYRQAGYTPKSSSRFNRHN